MKKTTIPTNKQVNNKAPQKSIGNPFGGAFGGANLMQAQNKIQNMNAFYNNLDQLEDVPTSYNTQSSNTQSKNNLTQNANRPAPSKVSSKSIGDGKDFMSAINQMQNMNALYNNEDLFGPNQVNNNNATQHKSNQSIKQNIPQSNAQNNRSSNSQDFGGQGLKIGGGSISQNINQQQQTTFNENLFERIVVNEDKLKNLQQENNNLFSSQSKYFQKEHASEFSQNIADPKLVYHWNSVLSSVQCEENLFFNFSKFQNEYNQVFFNLDDGQQFTDQVFPNHELVLNGKQGNYMFRRANEIYENNFNVFDLTIEPNQIQQGQLGDCYLISSIIALAEHPELCTRLLVSKEKNSKSTYGVWLCESGEWKQFVIDDYLVCNKNGVPCFAKAIKNGIWVQLIEKAYAKCFGGYGKIEVGYSFDSLRDLTGSPTEYIDIKKNYAEAFETIQKSIKNKYILTASSKMSATDLQSKHSYTIFDAREITNSKGQKVKLLKIKNPLGFNFQMNQTADPEIESKLGEPFRQNNGILWMNEKEILANFEVFTVCHSHPGYVCGSYTAQNKSSDFFYVQNLVEGNHCYFSVFQKHEKFYKKGQNDQSNYYKTARLIVTQIDTGSKTIVDVIGGTFSNKQQAFFEVQNLPRGEFLVFVEIDGKQAPLTNQFTLQTYSKYLVSISPAFTQIHLKVSQSEFIQTVFQIYIKKINSMPDWTTKIYDNTKGEGTVVRDFSSLFGYAFISYRNISQTQFTETIEVVEFTNLDLMNFEKTQKQQQKQLILQPNQSIVLLYRILENNACSHSLKFKSTWFFGSGVVKVPIKAGQSPAIQNKVINKQQLTSTIVKKTVVKTTKQ